MMQDYKKTWSCVRVLRLGTRAFFVLAAVLVFSIAVSFMPPDVPQGSGFFPEKTREEFSASAGSGALEMTAFEEYVDVGQGRDFFAPPDEKSFVSKDPGRDNLSLGEGLLFSGGFKLKGIVLDQDPMIIIEDMRQQTLFLRKEERVGEAVIKEILDGKVVFEYQGRVVEMEP